MSEESGATATKKAPARKAVPNKTVYMLVRFAGERFAPNEDGESVSIGGWPEPGKPVSLPKPEAEAMVRMGICSESKPEGDDD